MSVFFTLARDAEAGMPSSGGSRSRPSGSSTVGSVGSVLVYSWQPVRELTGTDGARHAGMSQRLLQVVRSSCRLQLQVYYISGQAEPPAAAGLSSSRRRGHIFVEGCRVTHFQGNTEAQVSLHPQHPAGRSTRPAAGPPRSSAPPHRNGLRSQYAHFVAHMGTQRAAQPLFGFLFYTGAWFPVEQRLGLGLVRVRVRLRVRVS